MAGSLDASFTPLASSVGGALIGLSAASLLLVHGRVAGVSGIFAGLRTARGDERTWRALFLAGLVAGSAAWAASTGAAAPPLASSGATYALAGLLVGLGTRLANGCTSGHGVCGLARGSARSLAAVGTFMATGVATASARRRLLPAGPAGAAAAAGFAMAPLRAAGSFPLAPALAATALLAAGLAATARPPVARRASALLCGATFGAGLAMGGMTRPAKVLAFLDVAGGAWDPSLALVMASALTVSALGVRLFRGARWGGRSLLPGAPPLPSRTDVDARLLLGSALFGAGWGVGGLCPGPALAAAPGLALAAPGAVLPFLAAMAAGQWLSDAVA